MLGITSQEARDLLIRDGANELPEESVTPVYAVFIQQFMNPLTYILLGSAIVSLVLKEYVDTAFIFFVVLVNAVIGTVQEYSANKSAQSLKKMVEIKTFAIRDGVKIEIPARELVVGDYVVIEEGAKIPADIILNESKNLKIDESMFTGESLPVVKDSNEYKDNSNKVFAGTVAVKGFGGGVVIGTGLKTEIGKIAEKVTQKTETKSPLVERMDAFTEKLTIVMAILILVISVISFMKGISWRETLMLASSLGVAAIPEGLPIAITICLAIGMNRMAKKNIIVKNLATVESLGSCTTIASDKTGTLTINQMSVVDILTPSQKISPFEKIKDYKPLKEENFDDLSVEKKLLLSFTLSNEATEKDGVFFGDPVDIAFLRVA
ncbi:MAG: HAD-IC family P-type ATPase, partial [Rickettsiales bacterium]|nr:HAD-IC family P-type ATPase [Rickettsiales bacterium]